MLVKLAQVYGFSTGAAVPACQLIGPFSCQKPSMDEQPGPPLSQMVISSSLVSAPILGLKKKKSSPAEALAVSMGIRPE